MVRTQGIEAKFGIILCNKNATERWETAKGLCSKWQLSPPKRVFSENYEGLSTQKTLENQPCDEVFKESTFQILEQQKQNKKPLMPGSDGAHL